MLDLMADIRLKRSDITIALAIEVRSGDAFYDSIVRHGHAEPLGHGDHAAPNRQRVVLFIVDRRTSAHFGRYFVERQRQHTGGLQFLIGWPLGLFPAARDNMIGEEPQRRALLVE